MPSERPGPGARLYAFLRSQGLGVASGLATVLLFAVGSVVIAATREGASKGLQMDDLRLFFERPALAHLWLYLLVPVLAIYGLNTLLGTWHAFARKWRAGLRAPWHHGPAVIHVAFLVALLAHGVGGLYGREHPPLVLGPGFAPLGDGREARAYGLRVETHPNRQPKQITVWLEIRGPGGVLTREGVAFNEPLSSGAGAELWLLANVQQGTAARLAAGPHGCVAGPGDLCRLGARRLQIVAIHAGGHWGGHPVVRVTEPTDDSSRPGGGPAAAPRAGFLMPDRPYRMSDGTAVTLEGLEPATWVLLRRREAPGNPIALAAALLLVLGLGLMGRRFLQ